MELFEIIKKSWCAETAYTADRKKWNKSTPSIGQCAITALIIYENLGGDIFKGTTQKGSIHYWNIVNGEKIDLTESQFNYDVKFRNVTKCNPSTLKKGDTKARYILLKKNMEVTTV